MNITFEELSCLCPHHNYSFDESHIPVSACHCEANTPSGQSWGECKKSNCPMWKENEVEIVDFMVKYIKDHDVPSLIELVLKAIQKVEGEENDKRQSKNITR